MLQCIVLALGIIFVILIVALISYECTKNQVSIIYVTAPIVILLLTIAWKNIMRDYGHVNNDIKVGSGANNKRNFIIFPVTLFEDTSALEGYDTIYIVEDSVYFQLYKFHKLKLALHIASMNSYAEYLKSLSYNVEYITNQYADELYAKLESATAYDPVDHGVRKKLKSISNLTILPTPYFLTSIEQLNEFKILTPTYSHDTSFYRWQRKRLNILMESDGVTPIGKWTYDTENREKFPIDIVEPVTYPTPTDQYRIDAIARVKKEFPSNYGSLDYFIYPINHEEARQQLKIFIDNKFKNFGKYQDGSSKDIAFGYHSVISSSLNIGLLTPQYVLDTVMSAMTTHKIPIASVEGFIRQLIGWREYCRLLYEFEGEKMTQMNYFNNQNSLSSVWWEGKTTLKPIDNIIARVNKYAYAHHIERLMYLSSVMLMCMIHPKYVYKWFMELVSIDAYDWVMTPNIYGMGSYADGGMMMSRPYFSSIAYVEKMSDHQVDKPTQELWNALYYNFIATNQTQLRKNYYTARWIGNYHRKTDKEKASIKSIASEFINLVS